MLKLRRTSLKLITVLVQVEAVKLYVAVAEAA